MKVDGNTFPQLIPKENAAKKRDWQLQSLWLLSVLLTSWARLYFLVFWFAHL